MIRRIPSAKGVLVDNDINKWLILNLNMIQQFLSITVHDFSKEVDGV
jgi:hypothetical protein